MEGEKGFLIMKNPNLYQPDHNNTGNQNDYFISNYSVVKFLLQNRYAEIYMKQ